MPVVDQTPRAAAASNGTSTKKMPSVSSQSIFSGLPAGKAAEVIEVGRMFAEDKSAAKENLSIGGYMNDNGKIHLMKAVKKAEKEIIKDPDHNHAYIPTTGFPDTNASALRLLLGPDSAAISEDRAFCVQSIGGTGPIRIGAEVLRRHLGLTGAVYSNPTWMNHKDIFDMTGFDRVEPYSYWSDKKQGFDLPAMLTSLSQLPPKTVVILHPAAHNPTGIDPTRNEWKAIADLMKERSLFPFFDCAYQGFASGDLEVDAWPVRHFEERGFEFFVSQSFGKNMGLYGERIGFLSGVLSSKTFVPNLLSQLTAVIRAMYSNPGGHGAKIVGKILRNPKLFRSWQIELRQTVQRVADIRRKLKQRLDKLAPNHDWSSLEKQVGMFYYSGLTESQGLVLAKKHHVYILPSSGRINVGAVTARNLEYVAAAIASVVNENKS